MKVEQTASGLRLSGPADLVDRCGRFLGRRELLAHGPSFAATAELRRVDDEVVFECAELGARLRGSRDQVLGELEHRLVMEALRRSTHPAALHAAVVAPGDGQVLLLVGAHGRGKTTLALALAARGSRVHGDDVAFLTSSGLVQALARPLRIKPPSLTALGRLGEELAAGAVYDEHEGLFRADLASGSAGPVRVDHCLLVRYQPGAPLILEAASSGQAVEGLLHNSFDVQPRTAATMAAAVELCRGARCWTLCYGTSAESGAAAVSELSRP